MKKKKIAFVAQSDGGVAEYLYMFLKFFDSEEYEKVLIVSNNYKNQEERFKPFVEEIIYLDMVRNLSPIKDFIGTIKLKKILKKIKPDIVYLNSSKAGGIGRLALWFNKKVKVIYNAHGWFFNAKISNKKQKLYAIIEKVLAYKTDMIINISKDEYDSALERKIASKDKMCIIENGIDFEKFNNQDKYRNETRKELKIKNEDIVIGAVGRLSEQKDPMTGIKAFKLVNEKYPNTKMIFVGAGELEENIIKYAENNNLRDKIIITGWVEKVEKYIPTFDIAVLPSKWEGFGLAIVEYMACNKPVIASEVGGIKNIISNNVNGILIQPGDYKNLSKKICDLIEKPKMQEKIVNNYKEIEKRFSIQNVVIKHIKIFESITK